MKVAAQNKALDAPRENRLQVVISVVDDLLDTQYHHHLAQDDLVLVWCASIAEVVQSVGTFAYDVAVLDVSSEPEPLESIRLIKNRSPRTSLIVLNTTPGDVVITVTRSDGSVQRANTVKVFAAETTITATIP
ncbi:MAG: hypothetical protein HYR96_06225 [Deltaproteobacteria bacterium]|nr:hypothetical protein [Deltaproteobacteria bacterium]